MVISEQLKWFYAGLTGFCSAYFLALFSFTGKPTPWLECSTILFATALPMFAAFTLAHITLIEDKASDEVTEKLLEQAWIHDLTVAAARIFTLAMITLIGHFSWIAAIIMVAISIYVAMKLRKFRAQATTDKKALIEDKNTNEFPLFQLSPVSIAVNKALYS
ncbi:hypothetical protein HB761_24835 (plasmid) [Vibrio campbellii]|uniref:Uncharacterized protein n=1 Tax=Vibrio campbellii TaxID=680 RepID=A0AAE9SNE7_9VIBR|nr:hypothetical protein [Vibrio campbellii]UTZ29886.1 hypothetical protein HB761_24835 [Vibrio campbellii]